MRLLLVRAKIDRSASLGYDPVIVFTNGCLGAPQTGIFYLCMKGCRCGRIVCTESECSTEFDIRQVLGP